LLLFIFEVEDSDARTALSAGLIGATSTVAWVSSDKEENSSSWLSNNKKAKAIRIEPKIMLRNQKFI
jgi:hypothetical protein